MKILQLTSYLTKNTIVLKIVTTGPKTANCQTIPSCPQTLRYPNKMLNNSITSTFLTKSHLSSIDRIA